MTETHKKSFLAILLSFCGCGPANTPPPEATPEPTVEEEISVSGFDPDGEPIIQKWSDGSIVIQFEAMPPFFAEDNDTEAEFENFEAKLEAELGVPVLREDREVFLIKKPNPDTATKAQEWLENYQKQGS